MIQNLTSTDLSIVNTAITNNTNICMLNQYELIQNTAKLPIACLYMALAIFVILGFYWIALPFLSKWKYYEQARDSLPGFAFAISIWLCLILMYFTVKLDTAGFKQIELILLIITGIFALASLYMRRKDIIEWFKSWSKNE